MKRTIRYVAALVTVSATAIAIRVLLGRERAAERYECLRADFAWTRQVLSQDRQDDRLHEFLKARLYGLGVCLREADLLRLQTTDVDYGPVDEAALGDVLPEPPQAETPNGLYRAFMARLGRQ